MLKNQTLVLEARVNTSGESDPCSRCGRWQQRTKGMTETYVADTEEWVCPGCAFQVDPELARFAYDPVARPKRKKRFKSEPFGVCPECGESGLSYLNLGCSQWFFCVRHGLKWLEGENLFSCWREETEEDWRRNAEYLSRFREVDPYVPKVTRLDRIMRTVRYWISRQGRADVESDDSVPF